VRTLKLLVSVVSRRSLAVELWAAVSLLRQNFYIFCRWAASSWSTS